MIRCGRIPRDAGLRDMVAKWSYIEWKDSFPADTPDTYLQIFAEADGSDIDLPFVFVAWLNDKVVGTASLVADDELPGASEPGPWLAAVYVHPDARRQGIANALLAHVEQEAMRIRATSLYLYTHDQADWYARHGWVHVRVGSLGDRSVDVMRKDV